MSEQTSERESFELSKFDGHSPGPWRYEEAEPQEVKLKRRHWKVGQAEFPAFGVALAFGSGGANARLIAAAPALLAEVRSLHVQLSEAQTEIAALRQRVEACEKDAARYRWIRSRACQWEKAPGYMQPDLRLKIFTSPMTSIEIHGGEGFDVKVDDAIKWNYGALAAGAGDTK
jgi:hypothetical protein